MIKGPAPRKRGRPPLLSRAQILNISIEHLKDAPLEMFTMQSVSRRLEVAPMTLYGYFPSRDALLQAVAEDVFGRLDVESVRQIRDWREKVRLWCHIVHSQLILIPELVRLIHDPSRLTPAWIATSAPLFEALLDAPFAEEDAHFYTRWISRGLLGLTLFEGYLDKAIAPPVGADITSLTDGVPSSQLRYMELSRSLPETDSRRLFQISVESWIATLEHEFAQRQANQEQSLA